MKDFSQDGEPVSLMRLAASEEFRQVPQAVLSPAVLSADGRSVYGPDLRPYPVDGPGFYAKFGKRVLDCALVIVTLPISLLIISLAALALLIEGGSPFFVQERIGRNGRFFKMLKLRTMERNAQERLEHYLEADPELRAEWDETQKLKNDPRVTTVGNILRKTSLDELPQLLNVLRGDMSLVGPRPMMTDQLDKYGNPRAYYALRPGITGVWQVSGRNETAFSYRSVMDRKYLSSLTLMHDIGLLLKTIVVVVRRTGY